MKKEIRIGVYICHCGFNIAKTVRVKEVAEFASKLPGVVMARDYMYTCSDPGQEQIRNDIKEYNLNRVVVAACSPNMHEKTFRRVVAEAGLNPFLYQNANIREHCSWVHEEGATEKAKDIVAAAVSRVIYHQPLETKEVEIKKDTLVVGGGIAGMMASMDIANGGYKVHLVEKTSSIGGHIIQFDKTFPTLDCAACITTPKMSDTGSHRNINLLNYSVVEEVSGFTGNFQSKIRKKAKYIDQTKCTGCRLCFDSCPVVMKNEFDMMLADRKAVYIPFPQAVPNKAVIDRREDRPCKASCMYACPINTNVPGYVKLIADGRFKEAYMLIRSTNPFPSTCGRVCYAPCEVACDRNNIDKPVAIRDLKRFADEQVDADDLDIPEIEKTGKTVVVIGAGPSGLSAAHDLAMLGHSVTVFESLPQAGGMLRYGIPEYRLPKDVLNKEINYIKRLGADIRTGVIVGKDVPISELQNDYDAVYIAVGAQGKMKLGIKNEDLPGVIEGVSFLRSAALGENIPLGRKVAVIGGGNTAVDCARTALRLGAEEVTIVYRRTINEMPAAPEEIEAAKEEGIKIEYLTSPVCFMSEEDTLSQMECIRMELQAPDSSGRPRPMPIEGSEFTIPADTVITALGQVPETDFTKKIGIALGKNGTINISTETGATNIEGIFAGGDAVTGPGYVIDAIAAGKTAAVYIDRYLKDESLEWRPEKQVKEELTETEITGLKNKYPKIERAKMPELPVRERILGFKEVSLGLGVNEARREAGRCLAGQIEGCIQCGECARRCGVNAVNLNMKDEIVELDVGNIIVATGYDTFDPSVIKQLGYKKYDNVMTSLEFERINSPTGPTGGQIRMKNGEVPESIAIVHCVGSRDKNYHEYCSRVCCTAGLKFAHLIKDKIGADVYEMYIDMRSFGESCEEFYNRVASEDGVKFIRGKATSVTDKAINEEEQGKLIVSVEDSLIPKMLRVPVDMVILLVAMQPRDDSDDIARIFLLNKRADGFFMEQHIKLGPVSTMTEGVFLAGCCEGPKDVPDSVAHAKAAASEVLSRLALGKTEIEPTIAIVDEDICSGCGLCVKICAYGAPSIIEPQHRSHVNEALCKGCGACAATCPSGAISHKHFNFKELLSEVEALAA
ncbi:MAG: FAD-dependent oxidoreductase [Deltaproteobacteria bacterium]|nr:FAD-dependent oxidoreductase [Deltaproteobacteria bacterium]